MNNSMFIMSTFPIQCSSFISVPVINTLPYQKQVRGGKGSFGSHFQVAVHREGPWRTVCCLTLRLTVCFAKSLIHPWTACPGNGAVLCNTNYPSRQHPQTCLQDNPIWTIPQLKLPSLVTLDGVKLTVKANKGTIPAICQCLLVYLSGKAQHRKENTLTTCSVQKPLCWACTDQGHLTEVFESHGSELPPLSGVAFPIVAPILLLSALVPLGRTAHIIK